MTLKTQAILSAALALAFSGCSKDKSEPSAEEASDAGGDDGTDPVTSGTVALATIDKLPTVLDPMQAYGVTDTSPEATAAIEFDKIALDPALTMTASTGASFGRTVADLNAAFEAAASPSKAMCDTVNNSMKFIFEAGSPDFMGCIIKGSDIAADETLYDGTDKIYKLKATTPEGSKEFIVKIKVVRAESGGVERFTFHSCSEGSQEQWFDQQFSEGAMSVTSKMSGPEGSLSHLSLSAQVNADGKLVGLKTMDYRDTHAEENRYKIAKVTQSPSHILYLGSEGARRYYSFYELIDKNVDGEPYAITKLAVGDGAALVDNNGDTVLQGWNGDTFSVNADEERLAKVQDKEGELLPNLQDGNEPYTGNEAFDCDASAAIEVELPKEVVSGCMERFEIDQEGENFCSGLSY